MQITAANAQFMSIDIDVGGVASCCLCWRPGSSSAYEATPLLRTLLELSHLSYNVVRHLVTVSPVYKIYIASHHSTEMNQAISSIMPLIFLLSGSQNGRRREEEHVTKFHC